MRLIKIFERALQPKYMIMLKAQPKQQMMRFIKVFVMKKTKRTSEDENGPDAAENSIKQYVAKSSKIFVLNGKN